MADKKRPKKHIIDILEIKTANIDIFPEFSVISYNISVKSLGENAELVLPPGIELDSVRFYDNVNVNIEHNIIPSKDNKQSSGILISTIGSEYLTENPPEKVTLQFITNSIKRESSYHINFTDDEAIIIRRHHIFCDGFNFEDADIYIYGGDINDKPSRAFGTKMVLLGLESTSLREPGLITNVNRPLRVQYESNYEYIVGGNVVKHYSFEAPRDIARGIARFYYKHDYLGTQQLNSVNKGGMIVVTEDNPLPATSLVTVQPYSTNKRSITSPPNGKPLEQVTIKVIVDNILDKDVTMSIIHQSVTSIVKFTEGKPSGGTDERPIWKAGFTAESKGAVVLKYIREKPGY